MLSAALAICRKDLHLCFGKGSALVHSILLGLLLIFIFSLSLGIGEHITPRGASAVFWISSAFCQVLIFNTLYSFEENSGQRKALLLAPIPVQSVWLGKAIAGLCLLFCSQIIFLPAIVIFLGQSFAGEITVGIGMLVLVNLGCVIIGSLLGALSQGQNARESLLSIIIFPLLIPLFLAGINIGTGVFGAGPTQDLSSWFGMLVAFDAIFAGAAIFLFPYMYSFE